MHIKWFKIIVRLMESKDISFHNILAVHPLVMLTLAVYSLYNRYTQRVWLAPMNSYFDMWSPSNSIICLHIYCYESCSILLLFIFVRTFYEFQCFGFFSKVQYSLHISSYDVSKSKILLSYQHNNIFYPSA